MGNRSRKGQSNREKRRSPSVLGSEGIISRKEYEGGVRGVGYAHLFKPLSESIVDGLLLGELKIEQNVEGPYMVDSPRHVTSVPFMTLDNMILRYFQIGRDAERERIKQAMRDAGAEANIMDRDHEAEIINLIPIGGRTLIAEVNSGPISAARSNLKKVFSQAGVGMPEMHAPHFKVCVADNMAKFREVQKAAEHVLRSLVIEVSPVDAYFDTYTEKVRPICTPLPVSDGRK